MNLTNIPTATTPHGDIVDKQYWFKIRDAVDKCGERMFDIYQKYSEKPIVRMADGTIDEGSLESCESEMFKLQNTYKDVVFAICLDVFRIRVLGMEYSNAFNYTVSNIHDSLDLDTLQTVERLGYIATKHDKSNRPKSLSNLLRRLGVTNDAVLPK